MVKPLSGEVWSNGFDPPLEGWGTELDGPPSPLEINGIQWVSKCPGPFSQ